jgi:hypothetical protein
VTDFIGNLKPVTISINLSQDYVPEYDIGLVWEDQSQKPGSNLVPELETVITSS